MNGHATASRAHDLAPRIQRVEDNLVLVEFDGIPRPVREATRTLSERMQYYRVPGVSVAVINDYEIEWAKGYGVLKAQGDAPVTQNTLFEAASTSKTVTAVTALHSVEQGLLALDEAVNRKLTSWQVPESSFTIDQKVTLRLLLAHRAGVNRPEGGFGIAGPDVPTTPQVLRGELPAKNLPATVECVPGTEHRYSNFGYVIIQQLVEDAGQKSFSQIVQETVLRPLGMQSSTFEQPLSADLRELAAVPHDANGEPEEWGVHPTALGQGGLWTTPSDLARFAIELMHAYRGESTRVLSQEMVERMFTAEVPLDPEKFFGFSGQRLGFFLMPGKEEDWYFIHPGLNEPGATCLLIGQPETGQGTVVMTNGMNGQLLQLEIMYSVATEYVWSIGQASAGK